MRLVRTEPADSLASLAHATSTSVEPAEIVDVGASAGSLQVITGSPTRAIGLPLTNTSLDRPDASFPAKGSGVGVGTGPPGEGTSTMCVSAPVTGSPWRAAGCGM